MVLKESDIKFVPSDDEVGAVFYWDNRVFRAINVKHEEHVRSLISSDLYAELIQKNLSVVTLKSKDIRWCLNIKRYHVLPSRVSGRIIWLRMRL